MLPSAAARVAYELGSRYWRQGIGRTAVAAMLAELRSEYGVQTFAAVLKAGNFRSLGLLRSLGFSPASAQQVAEFGGAAGRARDGARRRTRGFGRSAMKVAACQLPEIRTDVSRAMVLIRAQTLAAEQVGANLVCYSSKS